MKRSPLGQEIKCQGHVRPEQVTKIPFGEISHELSDRFKPNAAGIYYSKCPHNSSGAKGERSCEDENIFEDIIVDLFRLISFSR